MTSPTILKEKIDTPKPRIPNWLLVLIGPALLWSGWPTQPVPGLALLLLIAWVPYLMLEQRLTQAQARKRTVFAWTYFYLLLWNAITTWWVSYADLPAGIAAVVLNALLMCLPLMAFRQTKKRLGNRWGYLSLPVYWIAFEQLHLHWDLTWPWLTLGNGFAFSPFLVQWYEYTGFLGGSVWVWTVNLSLFQLAMNNEQLAIFIRSTSRQLLIVHCSLLIAAPIGLSFLIGATYQEKGPTAEVVVVQPNVDPYQEKFAGTPNFISYDAQLTRLLALSAQKITPQTRLIIWPETALEESYWENTIETNPKIQRIRAWLKEHPGVALLTGITTVAGYSSKEAASATARYRDDLGYYDVFNAGAYFVDATVPIQFYHKSRLVPGVEKIPPLLTSLISHIDLGGTVGSYGSQAERTVYPAPANAPALRIAPLICYESIYGDFTAEYAHNGATLLGLFTNDAWWHDSPGYRQLLSYDALRCIETRRDLARSANTGFTGFFNQKGEMIQRETPWVQAASRGVVHLNDELTVYARLGEFIGWGSQVLAVLLLLWAIISGRKAVSSPPAKEGSFQRS